MKFVSRSIFVLFFVLSYGAGAAETAKKETQLSPAQEELKTHTVTLLEASRSVNAQDKSMKAKARGMIENSMNWSQVAKECLGESVWKKTSKGNIKTFENLLKDVIILSAFDRLDKFWTKNTSYSFPKVTVKGQEGYVAADFEIDGDEFALEYFFRKAGKQWKIYDISYEELRYSENIREQIQAFLRESNFSTLLGKLRKRKSELQTSTPEKAKKKG